MMLWYQRCSRVTEGTKGPGDGGEGVEEAAVHDGGEEGSDGGGPRPRQEGGERERHGEKEWRARLWSAAVGLSWAANEALSPLEKLEGERERGREGGEAWGGLDWRG